MDQKFFLFADLILFLLVLTVGVKTLHLESKIDFLAKSIDNANFAGIAGNNDAGKSSSDAKQAVEPVKPELVIKQLKITDEGYSPQEIRIENNNAVTNIKLANSGKREHSFAIDKLQIGPMLIGPGESFEFFIDKPLDPMETYVFYSNAAGDDPQTFKGILMVTK